MKKEKAPRAWNSTLPRPSKPLKTKPKKRAGRMGAVMQRRSGVKRKNVKRAKANHDRAYGSSEEIAAVNNEPCVNCGKWPSQNAHIRNGGMSRKADKKWNLPLCTIRDGVDGCHETFDKGKRSFRAAFVAKHGLSMDELAERRYAESASL